MASIQALGSVSKVRGALIFVEDIESELVFYRDVIGLRLLYRTPRFVRFDATQGTSLSLIAGGIASKEPKDFRRGGVVPGGHRRQPRARHAPARRRPGVRHEEVVRDRLGPVLLLLGPGRQPDPVLRVRVRPPRCRPGAGPRFVTRGARRRPPSRARPSSRRSSSWSASPAARSWRSSRPAGRSTPTSQPARRTTGPRCRRPRPARRGPSARTRRPRRPAGSLGHRRSTSSLLDRPAGLGQGPAARREPRQRGARPDRSRPGRRGVGHRRGPRRRPGDGRLRRTSASSACGPGSSPTRTSASWRETFDAGACSQAGGVAAEQRRGRDRRPPDVHRPLRRWHPYLPRASGRSTTSSSRSRRSATQRFGQLVVEGLR